MLATQFSTRCLADRIRRAYLRRRPWWSGGDPGSSVWAAAASALIQAHGTDRRLPLDPELFVASQPASDALADPWGDLVGALPIRRYRRRVRDIVRRLREELRGEIRLMIGRARRGQSLELQIKFGGPGLSPLGRYVAARRINREDLAEAIREAALRQHEGCPLYRLACRGLLTEGDYPASAPLPYPINPMPAGAVVGWN
ncbi:hypothetical protein [Tautonia sociabilis]|uniref:Uncharacterized protein n=1 Tax=Tautonia sociabilis TaxID=2080755 RepID=A0A432MN59_9BACT|nr:hypothetical protein [Tautonia sociabilis]RUL88873.1 hypothetical protein TsocGM_04490 [Tautonia sociabilis]